jgi:hypothetical protein
MALPPIIWKPTHKFGYPYKGDTGRGSLGVLAIVYHRIVGSLASADGVFSDTNTTRLASSTFSIGHINGRLEIHQYVDMSDAQWCNGGVDSPTAKVVLAHPGVNPNIYTVSIEHEDGATAGDGIVQPDTWAASIALTKLFLSGDLAAIRAAGIHIREPATAVQLRNVPRNANGLIDHHSISGPLKPYCWRRWLSDRGFYDGTPSRQAELIAALATIPDTAAPTEDSLTIVTLDKTGFPRVATFAGGTVVGYAPDGSTARATLAAGSTATCGGVASITQDPLKAPNGSGFRLITDGPLAGRYVLRGTCTLGAATTTADCTTAIATAVAPLNKEITALTTGISKARTALDAAKAALA